MIKSIIVEDDAAYSSKLAYLLKITDMPIEVMTIASTVDEAITAIGEYKPELIFLDIILDGGQTGFDLLKVVGQTNFGVIFTTSHIDNYIQQIRICGISCIIKPYILEELKEALGKYFSYSNLDIEKEKVNALKVNITIDNISEKTIWIADRNNYIQIPVGQILYCESANQYTHFYILSDQNSTITYFSSYGLGQWEKDLKKYNFCRINRSYLVNIRHVLQFQKSEDSVLLTTGKVLGASQNGKEELLKRIKM